MRITTALAISIARSFPVTVLRLITLAANLAIAGTALAQAPPQTAGNATIVGNEPPLAAGKPGSGSVAADPGPRAEGGKLREEMAKLDKKIKEAEEKLGLGKQASKSWDEQSARVKSLVDSHDKQAAACQLAKDDLKRRVENGTPEAFLTDGKRHVAECDEARKRYRGMIASLETALSKMRVTVDHVVENMNQLGKQQTEQLERKKVIDQLIGATSNTVKNDLDAFMKKNVGH